MSHMAYADKRIKRKVNSGTSRRRTAQHIDNVCMPFQSKQLVLHLLGTLVKKKRKWLYQPHRSSHFLSRSGQCKQPYAEFETICHTLTCSRSHCSWQYWLSTLPHATHGPWKTVQKSGNIMVFQQHTENTWQRSENISCSNISKWGTEIWIGNVYEKSCQTFSPELINEHKRRWCRLRQCKQPQSQLQSARAWELKLHLLCIKDVTHF